MDRIGQRQTVTKTDSNDKNRLRRHKRTEMNIN